MQPPRPPDPTPPTDPTDGVERLVELAFDLRWAWNHQTDSLWDAIDPDLWRETGNPWAVVQAASRARLRAVWADPVFREQAETLREVRQRDLTAPAWFQREPDGAELGAVAYFSLEFALSEGLPIYSGGLGNVAGDLLKAASDLGVPLVGVGLLYQQGYFRQAIDAAGAQREFFPFNDTSQLPVVPVRDAEGEWVRVRLPRPGPPAWLRAWEARVGRVTLYLLDSNDPANTPADRGITAQLYGGDPTTRLLQEVALGIGGFRLLRAVGVRPDVCHLNEGHAALVALERARDFMEEHRVPFDVALAATRVGNLFTTHTPVEAGFDRFAPELVEETLGAYARDELRIATRDLLALGRVHPGDAREPLGMAWLAMRASGATNAVSRRHEQVSRRIFQVLFPRWPEQDVPIGHVTNGVHAPTWDSAEADALWTKTCGPARWLGVMGEATRIEGCSDAALWAFRSRARSELVAFVRERLTRQLAAAGVTGARLDVARHVLDPDALTIGLARRFTAYKRPTLLLSDPARLARLLGDPRRPVQILVAGKAHPRDDEGKALVEAWVRFARRSDVRPRVVFLADYDLRLAERLVQGVDLWVNTPRPPWEACGTSGMKVLVNGGVNLSSLDGWWAEAYREEPPHVGWALPGDGQDDRADAANLYAILEREVVPAFYDRDPTGVPTRWVARMRASMAALTPTYSANRAVREYTRRYYVPAARAFARRAADGAKVAAEIVAWSKATALRWPAVRFGEVRVRTDRGRHRFDVTVYLDEVDPDAVAIELYADAAPGEAHASRTPMRREAPLVGAHGYAYSAEVPDARPASHYTPRAVPRHADASVPLELPLVAWPG